MLVVSTKYHSPRYCTLCRFPLPRSPKFKHHRYLTTTAAASSVTTPRSVDHLPSSQILGLRHSLLSRSLTATQLAESYLSRLALTEPQLRSFLHVASSSLLRQAAHLDSKIAAGEDLGPLAGVLVAVKDNICTADMPSTGGSRILHDYIPPFDATAVRRLKESGAIVLGKTNLDEFGMGSTTEGSAFQVTANPWDLSRVPGGSSGGSAAAVSARQCVVSLGSDTGGSVRQPASFCGVVGVKPTYGRVSRFGLMAYASSLDAIGCFSTSVADAALVLHALSGHDPFDATTSRREVPDFASQFTSIHTSESKPLRGLRVGLIRETLDDGVNNGVKSVISDAAVHLEELGCTVTEVSLPSFSLGLPAYYILASSESSSNLSRYDGVSPYSPSHRRGSPSLTVIVTGDYLSPRPQSSPSHRRCDVATSPCIPFPSREDPTSHHHSRGRHGSRPTSPPPPRSACSRLRPPRAAPATSLRYGKRAAADELNALYGDSRGKGFGSEVKMRILMGTYGLSAGYYDAYYKRAQQVRTLIQNSFKEALQENDILISPATPSAAYKIGEKKDDPLAMYAGDIMTVNVNLAGLPALVVPCGFVEGGPAGLPIGLQMIGSAFDEEKLLKVGHIFEQTLQGCKFVPPLVAEA